MLHHPREPRDRTPCEGPPGREWVEEMASPSLAKALGIEGRRPFPRWRPVWQAIPSALGAGGTAFATPNGPDSLVLLDRALPHIWDLHQQPRYGIGNVNSSLRWNVSDFDLALCRFNGRN